MSKPVRIANIDSSSYGVVAYVYDKGTAGQPDVLVETHSLATLTDIAELSVSVSRYVVIRDPADDGVKSIDNW